MITIDHSKAADQWLNCYYYCISNYESCGFVPLIHIRMYAMLFLTIIAFCFIGRNSFAWETWLDFECIYPILVGVSLSFVYCHAFFAIVYAYSFYEAIKSMDFLLLVSSSHTRKCAISIILLCCLPLSTV